MAYIKIYKDFIAIVRALDEKSRSDLFIAIMEYANGSDPEGLEGAALIAFLAIKGQIDRDRADYEAFAEKQKSNGQKGGRPKNPTVISENPKNPVVFNENPKNPTVILKTQKKV